MAYDELFTSTTEAYFEHGDAWKAHVCRSCGVEVFIDDDPAVLRHLDANVLALMPVEASALARAFERL